jgi:hypothetical protein
MDSDWLRRWRDGERVRWADVPKWMRQESEHQQWSGFSPLVMRRGRCAMAVPVAVDCEDVVTGSTLIAGRYRQCKRQAVDGSACCWQHGSVE